MELLHVKKRPSLLLYLNKKFHLFYYTCNFTIIWASHPYIDNDFLVLTDKTQSKRESASA